MQAVVFDRHGGPEVLHLVRLPKPAPADDEVLIRVLACGLNHGLDGRTRQNGAGREIKFPHILGTEVVGQVTEAGGAAGKKFLGRNVLLSPWIAEFSATGELLPQEPGKGFKLRGVHESGGYAEYIVAKPSELIALPDGFSTTEAAALPVSYTTAAHMLSRADLRPNETVLVLGAAGTVGIAAVQLAKIIGAKVIGAASTQTKRDVVRGLGADAVVDYTDADWSDQVLAITKGRGGDVVIEHIGEATWPVSLHLLAMGGRIAMCGASSGHNLKFDARVLWRKNASLHFVNSGSDSNLRRVIELWSLGKIKPVIAGVFPLNDVVAAHQMLSSRDTIGKVILSVKSET